MHHIGVDDYVVDVLLPDLAGHDRSPAAFLVYLVLWTQLYRTEQRSISLSLQALADRSGLSKTAVQKAIALLKRRKLVESVQRNATAIPRYTLIRHWVRRRGT